MEKKPKLKRDWKGRYVRLLRTRENVGGDRFKVGTIMEVTHSYGGLHLRLPTRNCPTCGRATPIINKVLERHVELLPIAFKPR